RWNNGRTTIYRRPSRRLDTRAAPDRAMREVDDDGLPDNSMESLYQDSRGRIWVSTSRGVAFFEDGQFHPVAVPRSPFVFSFAEESPGNIWLNDRALGLFHLVDGRLVEQIPWEGLGRKDHATVLIADRTKGGLWLGFFQGGVEYFKNGQVHASYAAADGLGAGRVNEFRLDRDGTLWAATEGGLSRLKDGRVTTLARKNGLPCDTVHWVLEDDSHSFWLYLACGLVSISRAELDAWVADPKHSIKATAFDNSDGVRTRPLAG